jgi:hypothetical protein
MKRKKKCRDCKFANRLVTSIPCNTCILHSNFKRKGGEK